VDLPLSIQEDIYVLLLKEIVTAARRSRIQLELLIEKTDDCSRIPLLNDRFERDTARKDKMLVLRDAQIESMNEMREIRNAEMGKKMTEMTEKMKRLTTELNEERRKHKVLENVSNRLRADKV